MGLYKASGAAAFRSFLGRGSALGVPLVLAALSLIATAPGGSARLPLRYDRTGVADGELWRLLSGHFAHLGASHLAFNLAGLALVWMLVGSAYPALQWLAIIVFSLALIDLGFWVLDPQLEWYVGLSGLLHAVLVAGVVGRRRRAPREALVLALLVAAKIVYEQVTGPLPGSEAASGGPVVVNAHLYGAIAGFVAAAVVAAVKRPADAN